MGKINGRLLVELKKVHKAAISQFSDYKCMIAIGSIATSDFFVKGRSDYDILLIFENDFSNRLDAIKIIFETVSFNDSILLVPLLKSDFLDNHSHSHDFSHKFRSKTLFGDNIIPLKKLPTIQQSKRIVAKGYLEVKNRLIRTVINGNHWSTKKVREMLYREFKHIIMYLAIHQYVKTGIYSIDRKEVTKREKDDRLVKISESLNKMNTQKKAILLDQSRAVLDWINEQKF